MTVRNVLKMGHPGLRRVASEVTEFDTPGLRRLVEDMFDTMRAHDGAGLAATQIGVDARVVIFEVNANPRYPRAEAVPRTVLVNPTIIVCDETPQTDWEGCLSVPGLRGPVPRASEIRYLGFDAAGEPIDRVASGFHARVVQHECDHLDGILYPQRMTDPGQLGFIDELAAAGLLGPVTKDE